MERIFGYFPRLKGHAKQRAGSMSGGEQQMLAIDRALMGYPNVFLLDEPSMTSRQPLSAAWVSCRTRLQPGRGLRSSLPSRTPIGIARRTARCHHQAWSRAHDRFGP